MALTIVKADRIVRTMLGLLEREVSLPALVWRDAGGDFRGAKDDTITIRLPSYFKANTRVLRAGTTRTESSLLERTVTVTLDTDVYGKVPITDEELTLDIESFNDQIVVPVVGGIVRAVEDALVTEVEDATYANEVEIPQDGTAGEVYGACVDARKYLNDSRVPTSGRSLIAGSAVEAAMLKDPYFVRADMAGSGDPLRSGLIGRIAGMPVYMIPALEPDEAYAFHRTAYVLSSRAPFVPRGVPWGATMAWQGFALRVAQAVDPDELVDNFHADTWIGTNVVTDRGALDGNGRFEPAEDPDESGASDLFVRAVKMTLAS